AGGRGCRGDRGGSALLFPVLLAQAFLRHHLAAALLRADLVAGLAELALPPLLVVRLAVALRTVGVLAAGHLAGVLARGAAEVFVRGFGTGLGLLLRGGLGHYFRSSNRPPGLDPPV